jgi:thiosulfate/3-mercaptopyruvate sulfurtransferase
MLAPNRALEDTMEPLVSTSWLAEHLGEKDLVVFDATMYLPNESKNGREEFARAHIPGAGFFDIDEVADPESNLPHMVPTASRFAALISALGVSNASRVVFYDQKGLSSAARGWWLMGLFGHDQAMVLDGGLPKWQREGRATASGPPRPAAPGQFTPRFRPRRLRGLGDMLENLETDAELVLDARAAGRFAATSPEPRPGLPAGRIPRSRNLPYTELLNPDFTFKSREELRARFAACGVDETCAVVTSCGSGVSAAVLTLGLTLAGHPCGALYDGSWTEWASHPDTPKES